MSWQAYIDGNLLASQAISQAAIHGLDGSLWATSTDFKMSPEEIKVLISSFSDPSNIRSSGLYANGQKYFALNCNDRSIYGKKESSGIICVKSKSCVIIGAYNEMIQPGQATIVVEKLADYLISCGY
ncbi:hypothetical protein BB561_001123 [Smittium simulii]|uniref:Profilin n=1 Tax=Smittium simulii TaxID=133385 RepID=A0A2T9YW15_9FUNG|nr:hypothetical protein BB561_001123 [Smittium simulii]